MNDIHVFLKGSSCSYLPISVSSFREFSHNGRLFTLGAFLKMTEVEQIFGLLFSAVQVKYQKRVGLYFGRLFHKRIWSPCYVRGPERKFSNISKRPLSPVSKIKLSSGTCKAGPQLDPLTDETFF
jgi:hypothetical protein